MKLNNTAIRYCLRHVVVYIGIFSLQSTVTTCFPYRHVYLLVRSSNVLWGSTDTWQRKLSRFKNSWPGKMKQLQE